MSDGKLDEILNPKTIAIVGASNAPAKRGYRAVKSLLDEGYRGEIFLVNPKEKQILGQDCYASVADLPRSDIDLAIICTPASTAPAVVEECGKKGIKGALILAGGFGEASEAGAVLEAKMIENARRYGMRIIGPNTNGMFTSRNACNTLGIKDVPCGPLALIANSANVIVSLVTETKRGGAGINTQLSVGNQSDVRFDEYVSSLAEDPQVGAIAAYVEGFKDAPAFLKAARAAAVTKPIVVYVAGRTTEGRQAAKSHSGSFAGDYLVGKGVLAQAGVTVVERLEEIYPVAEALTYMPQMCGSRVAVLSEGGGVITIAAEALSERGVTLARLSSQTQAKIHDVVPNASVIANPVDAGSGTDPRARHCGAIARAILEDPNIDALLIVGIFGGYNIRLGPEAGEGESEVAVELGNLVGEFGKPIIVQSHYADYESEPLQILRAAKVPVHRHIEISAQCLASAAQYHAARRRLLADLGDEIRDTSTAAAAEKIVQNAGIWGRDLLETEARSVLQAYGVNVPDTILMTSVEDTATAGDRFGNLPLALKVVSKDIVHKSDIGGVRLNVRGNDAIEDAFLKIMASATTHNPQGEIDGVLVSPMVTGGVEVIMGVNRDPQYGRVIMFGLGGVFVEVIRDVVFRALPLSKRDAAEMVNGIRYKAMLGGPRGTEPANLEALADLLVKLSDIAVNHPEIDEIDLNPVIAKSDACIVVDARMLLGLKNEEAPKFHDAIRAVS